MRAKSKTHYDILECVGSDCRLRIPVLRDELPSGLCPRCGSKMRVASSGVLDSDSRLRWPTELPSEISFVLDNIRSTFNVGAIMRVADGAGVSRVHLCGITPTPEHRKLAKTSLGAETAVKWTYHPNALDVASALRSAGVALWAMENLEGAASLFDLSLPENGTKIALIAGNEITGVDPDLLGMSERTFQIPMHGVKGSLNVAVALGIAAYWLRGVQARVRNLGSASAA